METLDPEEEFIDIALRPAQEVARRCIVLASLLQLAAFDLGIPGFAVDDYETTAFDLREWLRSQDLWKDLSPSEVDFFEQPRDQRSATTQMDPVSLGEAVAALAWTLGVVSAIEPLNVAEIQPIMLVVPEPWDSINPWLASQRLRPESDIGELRETVELWEWRLAAELELRAASGCERDDVEASISEVREEGVGAGLLRSDSAGNDLASWDLLDRRDVDEIDALHTGAMQRLKALNWVCGFGQTWDDVPLEV